MAEEWIEAYYCDDGDQSSVLKRIGAPIINCDSIGFILSAAY